MHCTYPPKIPPRLFVTWIIRGRNTFKRTESGPPRNDTGTPNTLSLNTQLKTYTLIPFHHEFHHNTRIYIYRICRTFSFHIL